MAQTITINVKTLEHVVSQLDALTKDVAVIKKQLLNQEPPYGSDAWWEKEIKEGEDDIKKGRVVTFHSVDEMQKHLDTLK